MQDPETTLQYSTVFISDYSHSNLLSHGWQVSRKIRRYKSITLPDHLIASSWSLQHLLGKRVIVVRQVLSKAKVAMLLLSLLVFGIILGVVVGTCTGRADVAVAIAAGVFACITVLQGLLAWLVA